MTAAGRCINLKALFPILCWAGYAVTSAVENTETAAVSVDAGRLRLTDPAGAAGVLLGMRCRDCGIYLFGPAVFCPACTAADLEPVELSRQGTLYSYTIVRVPPAGWPGPVPYVLGEVELPEGPHILAEVIDCPEGDLAIGLAVELAMQPVVTSDSGPTRIVYKWRPAAGGKGAAP